MSARIFKTVIMVTATAFTLLFGWLIIPPMIAHPDIIGGFAAGFVNPYASGYSADVIACWVILTAWILYEARAHRVRHGWICVVLGLVPGVAVGFAVYLLLRMTQLGGDKSGGA